MTGHLRRHNTGRAWNIMKMICRKIIWYNDIVCCAQAAGGWGWGAVEESWLIIWDRRRSNNISITVQFGPVRSTIHRTTNERPFLAFSVHSFKMILIDLSVVLTIRKVFGLPCLFCSHRNLQQTIIFNTHPLLYLMRIVDWRYGNWIQNR